MKRINCAHRVFAVLLGIASVLSMATTAYAQGAGNGSTPLSDPPFIASPALSRNTASTIPGAAALTVATDWPTFGMDRQRSGYNAVERVLNTGNVSQLHAHWTADIGGPITTQPTLITGVSINGKPTDVVYAATWSGRIVALNAATGEIIWNV
jgi:glucose dehydrogenase